MDLEFNRSLGLKDNTPLIIAVSYANFINLGIARLITEQKTYLRDRGVDINDANSINRFFDKFKVQSAQQPQIPNQSPQQVAPAPQPIIERDRSKEILDTYASFINNIFPNLVLSRKEEIMNVYERLTLDRQDSSNYSMYKPGAFESKLIEKNLLIRKANNLDKGTLLIQQPQSYIELLKNTLYFLFYDDYDRAGVGVLPLTILSQLTQRAKDLLIETALTYTGGTQVKSFVIGKIDGVLKQLTPDELKQLESRLEVIFSGRSGS